MSVKKRIKYWKFQSENTAIVVTILTKPLTKLNSYFLFEQVPLTTPQLYTVYLYFFSFPFRLVVIIIIVNLVSVARPQQRRIHDVAKVDEDKLKEKPEGF